MKKLESWIDAAFLKVNHPSTLGAIVLVAFAIGVIVGRFSPASTANAADDYLLKIMRESNKP